MTEDIIMKCSVSIKKLTYFRVFKKWNVSPMIFIHCCWVLVLSTVFLNILGYVRSFISLGQKETDMFHCFSSAISRKLNRKNSQHMNLYGMPVSQLVSSAVNAGPVTDFKGWNVTQVIWSLSMVYKCLTALSFAPHNKFSCSIRIHGNRMLEYVERKHHASQHFKCI